MTEAEFGQWWAEPEVGGQWRLSYMLQRWGLVVVVLERSPGTSADMRPIVISNAGKSGAAEVVLAAGRLAKFPAQHASIVVAR